MAWTFNRKSGYHVKVNGAHRSGLEDRVIEPLKVLKVPYAYEQYSIKFTPAIRTYTPDLVLENGLIIEIKGLFLSADRSKHKWIRKQYPHLEIRFVFQSARTKVEGGSVSNAEWCKKNGFQYAEKFIPREWLNDKTTYSMDGLIKKGTKKK